MNYSGVIIISLLSLFIFCGTLHAEIRMFLYPKIDLKESGVALEDVAVIDGNKDNLKRIGQIKIPHRLYSDGYLDRKEIGFLIKQNISVTVFIYGNAVKINAREEAGDKNKDFSDDSRCFVKSGERVKVIVIKNGILVELIGTALMQGNHGDEIKVRLKGSRVISGKLTKRRVVEVTL